MTVTHADCARLSTRFDHHDPAFTPDLAIDVHRALREQHRVTHSGAYGGMWILSHYDDVAAALKDHNTFRSGAGVFFPRADGTPRFAPLEYDPPEHGTYRKLMRPPFLLAAADQLSPRIAAAVAELIAPIARRGHGDFVAELAVPIPLAVVGMAVGFSDDAQRRIRSLTSNTWDRMAGDDNSDGFWPPFAALFRSEIHRARTQPGDDYLSTLVQAEFAGRPVTDDELHVMLVAFAIAGHETSMNTLAHLLWQLSVRPDLQDRLRANPELMPVAIEETLRLWSPVDHGTRLTSRPVTIGDTTIPQGARVVLLTGAANRDPRRFPEPDQFSLDRGPIRHLTFGHGIHFCIGAHVARAEFRIVLDELARYPNYRLARDPRRYFENGRHICLDAVPVHFDTSAGA
jgi:cytochrome P450